METITCAALAPPESGDPSYFDLRTFPTPKPGENWVQARMAQVAAIERRKAGFDLHAARRHIAALALEDQSHIFLAIDEASRKRPTVLQKSGSLAAVAPWITEQQQRGRGVFVTVQEMRGTRRLVEAVETVRAVFAELDGVQLPDRWPLEPSLVVCSSPGRFHVYWLTDPADPLTADDFTGIMARMVETHGSDPNAKDLARVLRLAGTWNLKREAPHQVSIIEGTNVRYGRTALLTAFPPMPEAGETRIRARVTQAAPIAKQGRGSIALSGNSPAGRGWDGVGGRGSGSFEQARRAIANLNDGARLRDVFADLVPAKPYCTDYFSDGLEILNRSWALRRKHLQPNGPTTVQWLGYDLDYRGARFRVRDAILPPPNIITTNPDSGHAHALYLLEVPVARHDAARLAPLRYLAAVERGLHCRLDADPSYVGLVTKNPLHPAWRTEWLRDAPYELDELDGWLWTRDKRNIDCLSDMTGLRRNCTVFDKVGPIAYKNVLPAKRAGKTREEFQEFLHGHAAQINTQFHHSPLPPSEIRAIAKSVARWTWKEFTEEKFSKRQSFCGKRGAAKRWEGHVSARKTRPWDALGISERTYHRRRKALRMEGGAT